MCVNVIFDIPDYSPAPNMLQKEVFFSNPRLGRGVLRLHFKKWHSDPSLRSETLPDAKVVFLPNEVNFTYNDWKSLLQDESKFKHNFLERIRPTTYRLPFSSFSRAFSVRAQKTRLWALIYEWGWINMFESKPEGKIRIGEGEASYSLSGLRVGGWRKDGYGCWLGYLLPLLPGPVPIRGAFQAGPSGLIYQVGEMWIELPEGNYYSLWLRCSDTGKTQEAIMYYTETTKDHISLKPLARWLGGVPHVFPARGYFFAPEPAVLPPPDRYGLSEPDDEYALRVAEEILITGGFDAFSKPPEKPSGHLYDFYATLFGPGNPGPFGVDW